MNKNSINLSKYVSKLTDSVKEHSEKVIKQATNIQNNPDQSLNKFSENIL
jgi:hypothetical protein